MSRHNTLSKLGVYLVTLFAAASAKIVPSSEDDQSGLTSNLEFPTHSALPQFAQQDDQSGYPQLQENFKWQQPNLDLPAHFQAQQPQLQEGLKWQYSTLGQSKAPQFQDSLQLADLGLQTGLSEAGVHYESAINQQNGLAGVPQFDFKKNLAFKQLQNVDLTGVNSFEHDTQSHVIRVPVPQPYAVHIPVKQPFNVPIYKLVTQEIEKKIPVPVEKLVPVYKETPVKVIVEKHHPYHVYKPYHVPVPVNTHVYLGKKKETKWH